MNLIITITLGILIILVGFIIWYELNDVFDYMGR